MEQDHLPLGPSSSIDNTPDPVVSQTSPQHAPYPAPDRNCYVCGKRNWVWDRDQYWCGSGDPAHAEREQMTWIYM